ncbi:helix-turn-helix domain-containing protein [Methylobacterium sp. NMS14P]|uniref:helix-turn-helix domain-containing protein n=1 Tax=Methylobacterium sp. NMS14P TaxID=2894310 RepID=UPI0023598F29|nr:helix-turn-helix domain-containing protein [Methylobacterium sp. NMS14P]WCS27255.1 helix-turn-helix domain-containing protein [Methylobacterium sp. NMS14P]
MSVEALRWAKTQKPKSATQRAVLMAIADYANEHGKAWPSQKTLADEMMLTDRTIRTALAGLEDALLVMRFSKRNPDGTRGVDRIQLVMTPELHAQAVERIQRKKLPVVKPPENDARTTGNSFQNHRKLTTEPPEARSGQEPSLGEPPLGIPHKQNGSEATASGRPAGAALPADASWTDRLWLDGKVWLMECGCTPKLAGDVIGQWLRRFHDPERIHGAIAAAKSARTQSPIPYVLAVLDAPQTRPRASPRQRSSATTRLIERMEARHARQANRDQEDAAGSRGSGPLIEHEGDGRPAGALH